MSTRCPQHTYYYTASVYRLNADYLESYDVHIDTSFSPMPQQDSVRRTCVYELITVVHTPIELSRLTSYMEWKFPVFQVPTRKSPVSRGGGGVIFRRVHSNVAWIKSIIEVEFDYHLGQRLCKRPENSRYLKAYCASAEAGYGPDFIGH